MTDATISDITVQILRDIREDIRGMKNEVRGTNERLETVTDRLDVLTGEVHTLADEVRVTNSRLSVVEHTVKDAAAQIRTVGAVVVNKHEKAIDSLRKRVARLEAKARS